MTLPSSHDGVLSMVYEAVARTNEDLEPELRIEARPDEMLMGPEAKLDSLGFVSLILEIEALARERLGVTLELVNDRALSQERSPFRTLESLVAYVEASID
jgi:D-alanine--poly(phosphoribitol) ligase subunit 2